MKTISTKSQKILKISHILFMSIWVCSIFTLTAIMLTLPNITNAYVLLYSHQIQEIVDFIMLSPAAALTLITGLIYIFFTKWKLKQSWLLWKLIITIVIILVGTFWLGPVLKDTTLMVKEQGLAVLKDPKYIQNCKIGLYGSIINGALVIFAVAISTLKPNRNKKNTTK